MSAAPVPQKVCVVCGQNVAAKPRVKDSRGQYRCAGECEKIGLVKAPSPSVKSNLSPAPKSANRAAPPKIAEEAEADNELMNNLISQSSVTATKRCDSCGHPLAMSAVLCMNCGVNVATGETLKTHVAVDKIKAPKVKKGSNNPYAYYRVGPNAWAAFAFLAVIGAVLSLLPFANREFIPITLIGVRLFSMITGFAIVYWLWEEEETLLFAMVVLARVLRLFMLAVPGGVFLVFGIELLVTIAVFFRSESAWTKATIAASFLTTILSTITIVTVIATNR